MSTPHEQEISQLKIRIAGQNHLIDAQRSMEETLSLALATANATSASAFAQNSVLMQKIDELTASNVRLAGQYQEKTGQVEEIRLQLQEKIHAEVSLEDKLLRVELFVDEHLRCIARLPKNAVAYSIKHSPGEFELRAQDRRVEVKAPIIDVVDAYERVFKDINTVDVRKALEK